MFFASDNTGPAHPHILEAIAAANDGFTPAYGADDITAHAINRIREVLDAPQAAVFLVVSGTAANAITLASFARPWQTVLTAETAHVHEDECGATEFMTGGSKITLVPTCDGKITADDLAATIASTAGRGTHGIEPGPVSLTNVTERGTLYSVDDIRDIADTAHAHDLPLHLDGARFANALAALGCSPADMTWRAGVDALSFGATKNGCLGAEAIVIFDPDKATEIERRRMRAGHLLSKQRYIAAQFLAWLEDDLWLDLAARANAAAQRLTNGLRRQPDVSFLHEPAANMLFVTMPRARHRQLFDAGAVYGVWTNDLETGHPDDPITARLVCDWSKTDADIDAFLALF